MSRRLQPRDKDRSDDLELLKPHGRVHPAHPDTLCLRPEIDTNIPSQVDVHTQKCSNNTDTAVDVHTWARLQMCATYREAQGIGKNTHDVEGCMGGCQQKGLNSHQQILTEVVRHASVWTHLSYCYSYTRIGILTDVFVQEVHLYTYMGTHHSCTLTQTHVDTQMCTTTHMYLINSCTDRGCIYTHIYKDTCSQTHPQTHVRAQKHTQTPAHMLRHCQQPGRHAHAYTQTGPGSQLKPGPLLPTSCQLHTFS